MVFVITGGCCNEASCVDVCPVDCIRPVPSDPAFTTAEQLYIDPSTCIGCSACMYACPVSAIYEDQDLPSHLEDYREINRDYFSDHPLEPRFLDITAMSDVAPIEARVAVIGTGPSACYAIAELSTVPGIAISVFEKLPTPYGLVRAGVAPDHPDTKLVADYFQSVLELPNVTCYFNVEVGKHISIEEVYEHHHAVIYAGGANDDKKLGIDGEELPGSFSAREFVAWYNGQPDFAGREFPLSGEAAVVLGNGNVALDVARVLAQPAETYLSTDMADHAIAALRDSTILEVIIVARRGPAEAACSLPELLELTRMPNLDVRTLSDEVAVDDSPSWSMSQRRKVDIFRTLARDGSPRDPGKRRITFRFGWRPVDILGATAVEGVRLRRTGETSSLFDENIPTKLVLRAVGYRSSRIDGLPFDQRSGTIANVGGRAVDEATGEVIPGIYCVGWAKRGASGVIGTNKTCSRETVRAVLSDLRSCGTRRRLAADSISGVVTARQPDLVTLDGWKVLAEAEHLRGRTATVSRPRRKFTGVPEMLEVVNSRARS